MIAECQGGGGDLLIKLFGKTIPVPESGDTKDLQQSSSNSTISTEQDQDAHVLENAQQDTPDPSPQPEVVDAEDLAAKSSPDHKPAGHAGDGDGDGDAASVREKLRKPDKVLPCPRCNSMDTKFCYFNNYNVNQPRHFCKNCQRYWTAGGAMRNVPVGAGRRKNKNAVAASHFLHRVRACGGDTLRTTTNGTVLSFGGHGGAGAPAPGPACLDLAEQLSHLAPPVRNAGNLGPACSEGSSNRDANNDSRSCVDEAAGANGDGSVSVQQQHPAAASMNNVWPPPYSCAPSPAAAYFSSGIAIPMIYPAAAPGYWGACMVPGAWSLPWPVQQPPSSSSSPPTTISAPSISTSGAADSHTLGLGLGLGKHPRDREGDDGRNAGNAKVWAPKTIRIDDVDEVARSSIWSLIGIKAGDKNSKQPGAADAAAGGHKQQLGMVFEPKRGEATKKQAALMTSSPLLHANPVALTRSVAFQEGSA